MIREAEINDLGVLASLFIVENKHNSSLAPDVVRETEDVLNVPELEGILVDENQSLIVSERDGVVVGALLGNFTKVPERRWTQQRSYGYVEELVVSQKSRRQGVANELIAHFVVWAQSKGAGSVDLHVWSNNHEATGFYNQSGFVATQHLLTKKLHS